MSTSSSAPEFLVRQSVTRTFLAMMARDIRVLRRNFLASFINVILQPLLLVFVFAYVLPQMRTGGNVVPASGSGGLNFSTILAPGLIASSIVTQGTTGVIGPLMLELSYQRSISERALAPLSISMLAVQKIVTGALQALIAGLLVFPALLLIHTAGQGPVVQVSSWPLLLVIMLGIALLASSGGLLLGTIVGAQQIQMMLSVIFLPLTMLGCVYYPWADLANIRWLQIAVLVNPIVYGSEGMRAMLTPQVGHMPTPVVLAVLVGGPIVLSWLAARKFTARVVS